MLPSHFDTSTKRRRFVSLFTSLSCLLVFMQQVVSSDAFKCYVCDSKDDIECMENLPPDTRLVPQDCKNISDAKFCIKTTNLYADRQCKIGIKLKGELGTKRFCAANDYGNKCEYVRQPTGDRAYRSCVLTCDSELCNGAIGRHDNKQTMFIIGVFTLITALMCIHNPLLVTQREARTT